MYSPLVLCSSGHTEVHAFPFHHGLFPVSVWPCAGVLPAISPSRRPSRVIDGTTLSPIPQPWLWCTPQSTTQMAMAHSWLLGTHNLVSPIRGTSRPALPAERMRDNRWHLTPCRRPHLHRQRRPSCPSPSVVGCAVRPVSLPLPFSESYLSPARHVLPEAGPSTYRPEDKPCCVCVVCLSWPWHGQLVP